ncbi:MAG TPA: aldo/keto reductase, partial [Rhizomicrobium sp.]|nr:aldo/keto reductase [Rhizomicrobium sp.]
SLKERCDVVSRAVAYGITLFDTAPIYGAGHSERNLGETLETLGAADVSIATKIALEEDDLGDIRGAVSRSVDDSLKRLRRHRVAILHLHNRVGRQRAPRPNIGVGAQLRVEDVLGPVAEVMQSLKRGGVVDAIGCCSFGGEMDAVREVIDAGAFDGVLVNYSALNPSALAGVPADVAPDYAKVGIAAAERGMGIVALRILEGGALVDDAAIAQYRNPEVLARFLLDTNLRRELQRAGISLKEAATRFALFDVHVSTALVGISNADQLEEIASFACHGSLPASLVAALRAALSVTP